MDAVDAINKIGEGAPSGPGPTQGDIQKQGNAYLDRAFPMLTKLVTMRLLPSMGGEL